MERSLPATLDARELEELQSIVRALAGLSLENAARVTITRKAVERAQAIGSRSFDHYLSVLRSSFDEQDRLLEALTTKETYFFRQRYQFDAFEEEAYSIAYLLAKNPLLVNFKVHVVGTDLCESNVEHARRAIYRASSFRATSPLEMPELFEPEGDGFRVSAPVRRLCSFRRVNLMRPDEVREVGRVDAIFCRNVFIYMDEETRARVTPLFYERLVPGGYLFLGHTESLLNSDSPFEPVHLQKDLVYRRAPAAQLAARRNAS